MEQQQYQLDHSLDDYVTKMMGYGVEVNNKLVPALFSLKNGLKYPGLLTRQQVNGYEELVKMPLSLVLTSHKALKEESLSEVFADKFYKEGVTWQDRILVTFLLFLLSTDRKCIWTDMARQFSKQIDIVSFWEDKEFDFFIDSSVKKAAKKERDHFQSEWKVFEDIQEDYDIINDQKWFNRDNYQWIYTHAISRCFGSFLGSTYFVPFCQLFNHHCVDVSYTCFDASKQKQSQKQQPQTSLEEEAQVEEEEESISSGYSEDYISDEDFDYMSISSYAIKWCSKINFNLKDNETKSIETKLKQVYTWMDRELEWKGFTLLYLGQTIQSLKIYENEYKAGRMKYGVSVEKIENVRMNLNGYRKYLVELYRSEGREYQKMKNQRGVSGQFVRNRGWEHYEKNREGSQESYTHFRMEAREKAAFDKNGQIFFSYGKLSNRSLLIRYGFTLENNIYEHIWIKLRLGKQIEPYPDLFDLIQERGLSVSYKVKLKNYILSLEPIIYFRMCRWRLTHDKLQDIFYLTDIGKELNNLAQVKQIYLTYLEQYKDINEDLTDKNIGYHEYFARVYNKQKKYIISFQIELLDFVIDILGKIKQKQIDYKIYQLPQKHQKHLKHYFKTLRGLTYI